MHNSLETCTLVVPAQAKFARMVRMLASNVASLQSFTLEEIEDARMAAEEAFIMSCASGQEELKLSFSMLDDQLVMQFSLGKLSIEEQMGESYEYASLILEAVCASFTQDESGLKLVMPARE